MPPPPRVGPGSVLGERYRLGPELGRGGSATVFLATDERLGGDCAVKVLHATYHATGARRLEREARAAAALYHPNVCLVTDFGWIDPATPYLVMERLVGRSLGERLHDEGPLPLHDTLEIAAQVLSVLQVAHAKGYVHRDIKPDNLFLVDVVGRPPLLKVLDFGVASSDCDDGLTELGTLVGTPSYMSPEQAAAFPDIDGRADLYACGVVLYECLSGAKPFTGATKVELLDRIIRGGPTPIIALRPDLPDHIARAIDKAMRVEPEARFKSSLEMIDVLEGRVELPAETWDEETAAVTFEDATERMTRFVKPDGVKMPPKLTR